MTTNNNRKGGDEDVYDVVIVGGGIVGLATAVALMKQYGICNIRIYEKAYELHPIGANIGLFPNGLSALKSISETVYEKVIKSCIPIHHMIIYDADQPDIVLQEINMTKTKKQQEEDDDDEEVMDKVEKEETKERNSNNNNTNNSNSSNNPVVALFTVWYLLQQYLVEEISSDTDVLLLGHLVESIETIIVNDDNNNNNKTTTNCITVLNRNTGEREQVYAKILIGADGIRSTIRKQVFGTSVVTDLYYHNKIIYRGVLPLDTLLLLNEGSSNTCPDTGTSISYKGDEEGHLFAYRETANNIVTFTAMVKFTPQPIFATNVNKTKKEYLMEHVFVNYPEQVMNVIDKTDEDAILEHAVYDINVLECWSKQNVILIGDAAHAMTPGLGQGANIGLEDAIELAHDIASSNVLSSSTTKPSIDNNNNNNISTILESFWRKRIDRVKEVHAFSRGQTNQVNKSTKNTNFKHVTTEPIAGPDFMERLYNWQPSSSSSSSVK